MKRWSILFLTGLSACNVGGVDFTKPTQALEMAGNYHLTIQAAAECDLPVKTYEFDLVGVLGSSQRDTLVMTLAGGDRRVHLVFCGSCQADPATIFADLDTDGPPLGQAPLPAGRKLSALASLTGRVSTGQGGRTEVPDGVLEGTLEVGLATDRQNGSLGSCRSDVHSFSLRAR